MATPEEQQSPLELEMVDVLRKFRYANAEEQAQQDIHNRLADLQTQYLVGNSLAEALFRDAGAGWGTAVTVNTLAPVDYMALEMLGQPIKTTLRVTQEEPCKVSLSDTDNGWITLSREGGEIHATYDPSLSAPEHAAVYQALRQRRTASESYKSIQSAVRQLEEDALPDGGVQLHPVSPDEDIHGVLTLLTNIGMINPMHVEGIYAQIAAGVDATSIISDYMQYAPAAFEQCGPVITCRLNDGWGTYAVVDTSSKVVQIGFAPNIEEQYYHENASLEESAARTFIDTRCGIEMITLLQEQGMTLHPKWLKRIIRPFGVKGDNDSSVDMYGLSTYARLTNIVAKRINRQPDASVEDMFIAPDPDFIESLRNGDHAILEVAQGKSIENAEDIKRRLMLLDVRGCSEPTATFFELIQGCIRLEQLDRSLPSGKSLRASVGVISTANEGCGYATTLFLEGAPTTQIIESDGILLLQKQQSGENTCLLTEDAYFNSVAVPKGALFEYHPGYGGGWMMLRLTPFAFDDPVDREVFGEELKIALRRKKMITHLGGFSLSDLHAFVSAHNPEYHQASELH